MGTSSSTKHASNGGTAWAQANARLPWLAQTGQKAGTGQGWPVLTMQALAALVLLAPLVRGGNRHVALMGLTWLALAALVGMLWAWLGRAQGTAQDHAAAAGQARLNQAAWGVLLTAPLWLAGWSWLPHALGRANAPAMPTATLAALLAGLPLVACLAAGRFAPAQQAGWLARLWLWGALVQAVWGLLQVAGFDALRFDDVSGEPAIGSFASKNTYSNFLVMSLPLAVWRLGAARQQAGARAPSQAQAQGLQWAWAAAVLLLLATLLLATSRTGIATGVLVFLLAVPLLLWPPKLARGGPSAAGWRWGMAGPLALLALLGLALLAAGWEWAARFEASRLVLDNATRALMRQTSWHAALAHWPWGAGPGGYANAYAAWQPPALGHYLIDMAHNDYLQMLVNLGAGLLPLAAATGYLMARQLAALLRQPRQHVQGLGCDGLGSLRLASGLGVLAIALHAGVDYPFHIPANAMLGCFLLGVFLRPHSPTSGGYPNRSKITKL